MTIDANGFCTRCQEVAEWCECPPLPGDDGQDDDLGADPAADPADAGLPPEPPPDPGEPGPGVREPVTELGYARRLVASYGARLRYVPAWRRWLLWDGTRWAHDSTGQAQRWMKSIARAQTAWAMAVEEDRDRAAAIRLTRRGETSAAVAGALTLASTEPRIVVTPDDLDADPFLLNCANGTLDLRTGELREHDPGDLLTKVTRAAWRQDAAGPEFAKFIKRVQPDERMRAYIGRLLGHALEGRVTEHVLGIFYGTGRNGKGTLIGAVKSALGDYADAADPDLLTARTFDAHPTGTADLFGLRLAILHETDQGRRLAEATVKRLTGGDRIKARRMREDFWSFDPSHTFVMLTNHKPIVGGTDEAIWSRLRLVPWTVVIPLEERDLGLADKLELELDAVLAFVVKGYQDWRERGLDDPEQVTQATQAYRQESDALGRFIEQRCVPGHGSCGSAELFAAWSKWCAREGTEPGTATAFAALLQNKGFDNYTYSGRRRWRSITLIEEDPQ
jgi:putative DNA primase/helicase